MLFLDHTEVFSNTYEHFPGGSFLDMSWVDALVVRLERLEESPKFHDSGADEQGTKWIHEDGVALEAENQDEKRYA